MKIKTLRVHQSVKVGAREHSFLKDSEFQMELSSSTSLVRIKEKRTGAVAFTSLHNVPWFTAEEPKPVEKPVKQEPKTNEQKASTKSPGRAKQKK